MKYHFKEAIEKLDSIETYEEAFKLIYMWVKQDKITPVIMAMLNVVMYKKFS